MNLSVEGAKNTAVEFAVATAVFKGKSRLHISTADNLADLCGQVST